VDKNIQIIKRVKLYRSHIKKQKFRTDPVYIVIVRKRNQLLTLGIICMEVPILTRWSVTNVWLAIHPLARKKHVN